MILCLSFCFCFGLSLFVLNVSQKNVSTPLKIMFFKLSFAVSIIAILSGYILNFSAFKYGICKKLVENTFNERCLYNEKVLCLIYEDGSLHAFGSHDNKKECDSTIIIQNEDKFYEKLFLSFPAVALGEAYVSEYWDTEDDLGDVLTLFSLMSFNRNPNEPMTKRLLRGAIKYAIDLLSLAKWTDYYHRTSLTMKTQSEDAQTIAHHYDKSNDFYKLFLDKTMVYSCAIFDGQHGIDSLNDAQNNKLSILIDKMNVKKQNGKILDIGSGWVCFACYHLLYLHNNEHLCRDTLLRFSQINHQNIIFMSMALHSPKNN